MGAEFGEVSAPFRAASDAAGFDAVGAVRLDADSSDGWSRVSSTAVDDTGPGGIARTLIVDNAGTIY